MKHKLFKFVFGFLVFVFSVCIFVFVALFMLHLGHYMSKRNHGNISVSDIYTFVETSDYVDNPNRGFYYMYGFMISDDNDTDYMTEVHTRMGGTVNMNLAMVHVNLQQYNKGPISEKGLSDIQELFDALESMDRQYLLRFLYDWDGKNEEVEPQNIEIILTHIRQLEPIFQKYSHIIFVHQGLFIGNWGEMNGTKHLDHMQTLANTLHDVVAEDTYLGVRMPMQWRIVTGTAEPDKDAWQMSNVASQLSLYNDGMLGSYSDYGTYGMTEREEVGDFCYWSRTEELIFQDELCKYVPNGGEVIVDNPYNNFENALADMKTMHISYLNLDYDQKVLNKWAKYKIQDEGCYKGMDGLTYMERHMGYRLVMQEALLNYDLPKDTLTVKVSLQNVGFAPVYKETNLYISLKNRTTGEIHSYLVPQDIRTLYGGNYSHEVLDIMLPISMSGYNPGEYDVYFLIKDVNSEKTLQLAIEAKQEEYGYSIGEITIEPLMNPFTKKEIKLEDKQKLFGGIFFGEQSE